MRDAEGPAVSREQEVTEHANSAGPASKPAVLLTRRMRPALRLIAADLFWHALGRPLDKRLGVDTGAGTGSDRGGGGAYAPGSTRVFWLGVSTLPIDFARFAFVDLAAGKGRAVVLAGELPFHSIHGVEPVKALHVRAVRNVKARFGNEIGRVRIFLHNVDVSDYTIPDLPCVLYLPEPFGNSELPRVIESILRSCRANPRDVFIVDAGSGDDHAFDAADFEELEPPWWQRAVDRALLARFKIYKVRP